MAISQTTGKATNEDQQAERAQVTTELVVATAAEIADSEGLDNVTLTRVAKELGVSQPALYNHVDGYEQVLRELSLMGRDLLAQRLTDAAVGVAGDDAVAAMGTAWRAAVSEHPGLYAATDRYPCAGDPELEAAVNRIIELLSLALLSYELTDDQRLHVARTLRSAFHGFSHLEAGVGHPLDRNADDSFAELVELLCRGIHTIS